MSYDLAVWDGPAPATSAEASREFERRYEQLMAAEVPPIPAIAAFVELLTHRWPDLTELDDDHVDDAPWADGPLIYNARGDTFYFGVVYSAVEEVVPWIAEQARLHGLVCFDPQQDRLLKRHV